VLKALEFSAPMCPLVNNVDAKIVNDPAELRDGLVRQIPGAVRWEAIMQVLLKEGVTTFLELGPGKVLSGIAGRMAKEAGVEIKTVAISAPEDLAQLG